MKLNFFMCSNFGGKADMERLVEIMLEHDLILSMDIGKSPDGRLGPIPYHGEISPFVENAYRDHEVVNSSEIVKSDEPRFLFETITRVKYSEPDIP